MTAAPPATPDASRSGGRRLVTDQPDPRPAIAPTRLARAGGRLAVTPRRRPGTRVADGHVRLLDDIARVRLLDASDLPRDFAGKQRRGRPSTARRLRGAGRFAARPSRLPAAWPLKFLLVGFPVWWALGLSVLIFPILAVPMFVHLRRARRRGQRIALPPWFALWGLFLAWQVIGLMALTTSPPGTEPGSVIGRLLSIGLTLVEYIGVTVTMLYVGNLPRDPDRGGATSATIGRWLGCFFLTVLAGGFLGVLDRHFSFRSATELVLPGRITANPFVHSLVHPVSAQIQNVIGIANGRPSAPFGYTNTWGNALSLLLIWFVACWVLPATGWRRFAYAGLAAASIVPVVLSLNRGLWIGLTFTGVWLLGRQLLRGRLGLVVGTLSLVSVLAVIGSATPLTAVVLQRLQHGVSNDIRSFVANLSVVAIHHSPIIGYGGNRHALGSASSIAVGPTSSCLTCGSVATGSTGDFWALLFNQGVVGTALYFGFFLLSLITFWRTRTTVGEAALVTIALIFVYMLFYSTLPVAQTLTVIAVAILWRERTAERASRAAPTGGGT